MDGGGAMIPLGHYGGIDEVGVFVIPAVLAIVLLRWAERKAKVKAAAREKMEKADIDD
ncbi:MAG: hypothetical protein ACRDVL_00160 [Acidimicrobiia bacterium]